MADHDPESFCPWCKRTHDAPEFLDTLSKLDEITKDRALCKKMWIKSAREADEYKDEILRLETSIAYWAMKCSEHETTGDSG